MKYLYSCITVMVMVLLSANVHGQNMVPNGDFEDYTTCPTNWGNITIASGWSSFTTGGSPDYFNTCSSATSHVGVPLNYWGYQYAASGNGYTGIFLCDSGREYIKRDIVPLYKKNTYEVSFSVSRGDFFGDANNGMCVFFYKDGPSSSSTLPFLPVPVVPQISFANYGPITDTLNWTRLVDTFTADSAYTHIVIGGFLPSTAMTFVTIKNTLYGNSTYYYIDSVVIKRTRGIGVNYGYIDTVLCVGDTLKIPFSVEGFATGNVFSLQLSDTAGSFSSPTILDTLHTNRDSVFKYVITSSFKPGNNYRIRIISSNIADTSADNGFDIAIGNALPAKPVAGNNSPCLGDTLKLTASSTSSGVTYKWIGPAFNSNNQNPFIINSSLANSGQYIVTGRLYGCRAKDTTVVTIKLLPTFTLAYNTPICQNDTLKLATTNTSSLTGISYNWTGVNGFISYQKDTVRSLINFADTGFYINTAAANGCKYRDSMRVNIKPLPASFSASSNSPQCQGNSLSLTGNTTSTGVSFSWSGPGSFSSTNQTPSISNAQPVNSGSYILAATLNGCSIKDTEVVNVIAIPATPVPTANTPVCIGQSLNLNAGSVGPGWLWSGPGGFVNTTQTPSIPNAITTTAGTYTVKAIDGGCESPTASVTVTIIPNPTVFMYPSPKDSICDGATVTFRASASNAGTGATYKWFRNGSQEPGAFSSSYATIPLSDYDEYYCEITSNGTCAVPFSDTGNHIVMRVFPWLAPAVSIAATQTGTVKGGDLLTFNATATNGGNYPKYQWKRNNKDIIGALSYTWGAKDLADKDVVCVVMTSDYLCPQPKTANSNCITVSINTTGIDDTKQLKGISIYPNPVTNELVIEGISINTRIQLFDVLGRIVINTASTKEKEILNTSTLTKGTYLLQLTDANGNRMNAKVVKE